MGMRWRPAGDLKGNPASFQKIPSNAWDNGFSSLFLTRASQLCLREDRDQVDISPQRGLPRRAA